MRTIVVLVSLFIISCGSNYSEPKKNIDSDAPSNQVTVPPKEMEMTNPHTDSPINTINNDQPANCDHFSSDEFIVRHDIQDGQRSEDAALVLRFLQFSDTHITDDDGQLTNGASAIDPVMQSAQRIHEEYSDELLNSMITVVNRCQKQSPAEFMLATGDITDLTTVAETRRFIDNMDGTFDAPSAFAEKCAQTITGRINSDGFDITDCHRFTGTGIADTETVMPDTDDPSYQFQFTRTPRQIAETEMAAATGRFADGTMDPSRQTLTRSPGLPQPLRCHDGDSNCINQTMALPWLVAFGNHDSYIRGTVPADVPLNEVSEATGRRFMIERDDFIDEFFKTRSVPIGHGFNFAEAERRADGNPRNDGYYAFEAADGRFRMLVMDTTYDGVDPRLPTERLRNPLALSSGTIDIEQFTWLKQQLEQAFAEQQLVMVFSHHPDRSFIERTAGIELTPVEVSSAELNAELASWPNMLAWIAGHTHIHNIRPFKVENGRGRNDIMEVAVDCKSTDDCRGFWQIETSSLIDFPQEQRMIEVFDNKDGTGTLRTPVFSHELKDIKQLAKVDEGCTSFFANPAAFQQSIEQLASGSGCLGGNTIANNPDSSNTELMFRWPF